MARWLMVCSALSAALAVGLGAFGAHALKDQLPRIHAAEHVARMEANWETAARYHLIHAVGALLATLVLQQCLRHESGGGATTSPGPSPDNRSGGGEPGWWFWTPVYGLLLGPVIFSGCLYAMVLGAPRFLGAIVPIGGALMIAGWVALAWVRFTAPKH
jgi:uncharacterized membrane protein YgdD (TMEM256/DUF423 family)